MGCEDNNTRTTLYISKMNYNRIRDEKKKNPGFSLSKFVEGQLTSYFFGDKYEHKIQMVQITKRLDELDREQQSLMARKTELQKMIESYDKEQRLEQELYNRFISNMSGRLRNISELNVAPDYDQVCKYLQHNFFPNNNISMKMVKEVFYLVENGKMSFDVFLGIRRGGDCGSESVG